MNMKYSEDELHSLKQITDEVFIISNKPQLPLVQKMKKIQCDVMSTGYTKVEVDFFYWNYKCIDLLFYKS